MSKFEIVMRTIWAVIFMIVAMVTNFVGERILASYTAASIGFNNDASQIIGPELAVLLPSAVAVFFAIVAVACIVPVGVDLYHKSFPTEKEEV